MSGFLLILFSELGDKTFFIALLLALKQSQGLVFLGTFGALGVMTVISVGHLSRVTLVCMQCCNRMLGAGSPRAGHHRCLRLCCATQVALGQVLHQIDELLPTNSLPWDDIFAAVLLVVFGVKTLLVSHPRLL